MHRLVQTVARTPDANDPHRSGEAVTAARQRAIDLLLQALPEDTDDPAGWPVWRVLLPHATAVFEHTDPADDTSAVSVLLDRTGDFLPGQGTLSQAIGYFQRALACDERMPGPDHPDTLASRNNLAGAYQDAGDLTRAIPLLQQTLTDCERVLGAEHPITKTVRNNLKAITQHRKQK